MAEAEVIGMFPWTLALDNLGSVDNGDSRGSANIAQNASSGSNGDSKGRGNVGVVQSASCGSAGDGDGRLVTPESLLLL